VGTLNSWSLDFKGSAGSAGSAPAAGPAAMLSGSTRTGPAHPTQQALAATVDQALAHWQPLFTTVTRVGETDVRLAVMPRDEAGDVAAGVGIGTGPLFALKSRRPTSIR
jgi:hypothetical protein